MLTFKACPRCHGDVDTRRDHYGEYTECLQCGRTVDAPVVSRGIVGPIGRQKPGRPKKQKSRDAA